MRWDDVSLADEKSEWKKKIVFILFNEQLKSQVGNCKSNH